MGSSLSEPLRVLRGGSRELAQPDPADQTLGPGTQPGAGALLVAAAQAAGSPAPLGGGGWTAAARRLCGGSAPAAGLGPRGRALLPGRAALLRRVPDPRGRDVQHPGQLRGVL